MVTAGFVAPYLLDTTMRFVEAAARLPGVRMVLITCEPEDRVPPSLRQHLAGHWRIDDPILSERDLKNPRLEWSSIPAWS